jgi:uncharacterized protein (TIGR04255 family)
MVLPKKITPDSIVDAVVEIKYLSKMPFEVLIGLFVTAFDNNYIYTTRPVKDPRPGFQANAVPGIVINFGGQSLLYNDKISIILHPGAVIFNCLDKYIGWKSYKPEIEKALQTIFATGHITTWTGAGLRYITEYLKTDLKDCTNFDFTFGLPAVDSMSTTFRSEFEFRNARVILNLSNKVPVARPQSAGKLPEIVPTSIIDVDVIKQSLAFIEPAQLMKMLEEMHDIEKEVFFTLLTEHFLETLQPEY